MEIINKIYNVDCMTGMSQMDDDSVDITFTSPPYNIAAGKYDNYDDNYKDYYGFLVDVVNELIRVNKYYTFFNFQMLAENKVSFIELMNKFRNNIKDTIIWVKSSAQPNKDCLMTVFEFIIVLTKRHMAYSRKFERCSFTTAKNVIMGNNAAFENNSSGNRAVFPEYLASWVIKNFSRKGDTVFDPFMGSGTTAYCARNLGRNYLGFDIEKSYVDYCNLRLSQKNISSYFSRTLKN